MRSVKHKKRLKGEEGVGKKARISVQSKFGIREFSVERAVYLSLELGL